MPLLPLALTALTAHAGSPDAAIRLVGADGTLTDVSESVSDLNVIRTPHTLIVTVGSGSTGRRLALTSTEPWDPLGVTLPGTVVGLAGGTVLVGAGSAVQVDLGSPVGTFTVGFGTKPVSGGLAGRTQSIEIWEDGGEPDAVAPSFGGAEGSFDVGAWDRTTHIVITDTSAGYWGGTGVPSAHSYIYVDDPDG